MTNGRSIQELAEFFTDCVVDGTTELLQPIFMEISPEELKQISKIFKKLHAERVKEKKYYLLTFTLDLNMNIYVDNEDEILLQIPDDIYQILMRKSLKITKCHVVKELTKKGIAHWHASVETLKYLKKRDFQGFIKNYGFVDISKSKSNNYQEILQYISKESTPTKII